VIPSRLLLCIVSPHFAAVRVISSIEEFFIRAASEWFYSLFTVKGFSKGLF